MQRLLLSAGLLAILCLPGVSAEDKKDEKPATFAALRTEFLTRFKKADADGKAKLFDGYAEKFKKLAAEAKGDDAPPAIEFLLQFAIFGKKAELRKTAVALIKKDHLKTRGASALLAVLTQLADEENVALLGEIMSENPDKKVQGRACKALGKANLTLAKMARAVKDNEKVKENLISQRGESFVKFLEANEEKFSEKAAELKKTLADKYKDVFPDLSVGKPIPEAVSKGLDGKEVKLSAYKGKVIVVDIWATWCPPCVAMIPHERELVKKLKDKPFVLISVSVDDNLTTLKAFLKDNEMPWVHWHEGPSGDIISDWEVESFPTILVIDHKGIIRFKDVRDKKMDEAVEKLLKEMEDEKKSS